ncbi:DUF6221 family protein [Streptomyces olivaceoviridis]|uniref:DUF6221 family protein n=1 Tax=Streptomyces olivaceoviridis TaxID=1921 RepID=UPI0036FE1B71
MSEDLVRFLRARLDEDEQTARRATEGPWTAEVSSETGHCVIPSDAQSTREYVARTQLYAAAFDAEHIARHDPARVLREVEAWRAVLDFVETVEGSWHFLQLMDPLARVWRDHPDFNPAWLDA